ncbi:CLSTN1 [Mytilus edulis]|uniref:CLSTN1 n=1 Tax=Mytilus edulis TaxID=6550 RepID=A0A8S3RXB4_MYTED|nr:CLSTN1 [Mytilus edulis]
MSEPNIHDPVIVSRMKNKRGVPVFHGTILENESSVQLDQPLQATDADEMGGAKIICGYRTLSAKHSNCPFTVQMIDRKKGTAEIKLKEGQKLNFEKRIRYKFSVVAYDCGEIARESDRAVVFVKVLDVDEFSPKFEKTNLFADLREGKVYDSLVKVEAIDQDESQQYGKICSYEVITPGVPFSVDNEGNVKNTRALYYNEMHSYIIQVVAKDCGGKKSKPISINIRVKEVCKNGWKDFPSAIEYLPQSGAQKIAPNARLDWCDGCVPEKVSLKMHLATKHIGKGCDRDTYSIASQRKLCGASGESIDLLPSPGVGTGWTKNLPTDDGKESDQIFYFDGKTNAVEVPKASFNHTLHKHFTISTWMKHTFSEDTEAKKKAQKEHILCNSDGDGMDRHHYSMFVHGEKFVFLLRREAEDETDMDVFKPAEWRWHIPQINDNQWHHYAVSVDFPEVRLYIDGMLLIPDTSNEEILDDWPIHNSKKVHFTKLVVGACWQGKENEFGKYFHGYLAGLSILKDKTESERVIRCLNDCKENLEFHALSEMESGTLIFNSEMTEFSITSHNITEVERLLHEVSYINSRRYPTPGRRNVDMRTSILCKKKETVLPLSESYIMVQQSTQPTLTIQGKSNIDASVKDLKDGRRVFEDIGINVDMHIQGDFVDEILDDTNNAVQDDLNNLNYRAKAYKLQKKLEKKLKSQKTVPDDALLLDRCTIKAEPPLDFHVEHMTVPVDIMTQFNMKLESSETNSGLQITNADKMKNYELVLQGVTYVHSNAEMLSSRKFVLSCSSQNGRFISNDFLIKVVAMHQEPVQPVAAHAEKSVQHVQQSQHMNMPVNSMGMVNSSSPNVGMVAIIVVCVGFLMFMIILGVIRIRATHRKTQVVQVEDKLDMEWDNTELNITENPMEKEVFDYEEEVRKPLQDDSDSDDDISSYHDNSDSSGEEEETERKQKMGDLEWDDSTMSI